jgi:hypothetical protein
VVPLGFPPAKVGQLIAALSAGVLAKLAAFPPDVLAAAREAVRWGYSDAFCYVWYASVPVFVVVCVASVCVSDPSKYFTNHTAVVTDDDGTLAGRLRRGRHAEQPEKPVSEQKPM